MKAIFEKSLVYTRNVKAGEAVSPEMLGIKKPGTGLAPDEMERIVGRTICRDMEKDHLVSYADFLPDKEE